MDWLLWVLLFGNIVAMLMLGYLIGYRAGQKNEKYKKPALKSVNGLSPREIAALRAAGKHKALHSAVDAGMFDDNIQELDISPPGWQGGGKDA